MQENPPEHCYVVMQDHGPEDGGWGTAALRLSGTTGGPFVYSGSNPEVLSGIQQIVRELARATAKPTLLAKFTQREDIFLAMGKEKAHAV